MDPARVEKLYIVVREGPAITTYAPNRFEQRSKKFFSLREARERVRVLEASGQKASLYEADVSEWKKVNS